MFRFISLICLLALSATIQAQAPQTDPVSLVNPLMGTESSFSMSNGNTYPAIGRPWGMNYWSPQTGKMGDGWMYTYTSEKIRGFKQTHQPSPWMNDYGQFSIMPVVGKMVFREDARSSLFSHKTETVHPYYYKVYLAEHDVTTELTATERAAQFQFTFPHSDSSFLVVDAFNKGSHIRVIPSENKVTGYTTRNSGGVASNFRNYFVLIFDKPFDFHRIWRDSLLLDAGTEVTSDHAGVVLGFKTRKGEQIHVKAASSFISLEQAELNLSTEVGNSSFEQTVLASKKEWNRILGRVAVSGGSDAQLRTFYSCLYRTVCFPQKHYELDRNGKAIHYSPYNGKVLPGFLYAGTGFWDTFRALYPLLNLLYPSINQEMQEGLANAYLEGGFLPEWSSPGYRDVMVGNNSASVVADAYLKGLRGFDIDLLYQALLNGSSKEGPNATGRRGVEYYNTLGYVPYDVGINENVARSLEYAYDDFTIWKLAKALKRPASEISLFEKRMLNYKNLYDPQTKLMRGKLKNGNFQSPFNPAKWGDAFTEGNSWHYSWSVFHDIAGLIGLMGGEKIFTGMLDSVFSMPPVFDDSYYGYPIHEIREMQVIGMGQYAHGNQPIQHMIYLYNYAGQPWKTQHWAREIMDRLYHPNPDGYCGDEDNGQTSAWYVFSALGFYPVCPGTDQYVLGAPLFKKAIIRLENGKTITINAPQNGKENRFVSSFQLNATPYTRNFVTHGALQKGAILQFNMSAKPDRKRGTSKTDYPYSYSTSPEK